MYRLRELQYILRVELNVHIQKRKDSFYILKWNKAYDMYISSETEVYNNIPFMQNKCTKNLERLTEIVNDGYLWE